MNYKSILKYNLRKILAFTEKDLKLTLRYKFNLFTSYVSSIISIILPLIIFNKFLEFNAQFGPWTENNFYIYQFLAYEISLLKGLMNMFPSQFRREKYWQTLQATLIAPTNRLNLLMGFFLNHLILISIPFFLILIFCLIYYPISFITFIFILIIFLLIALIFSGMGIFLGIFIISKENYSTFISFALNFLFLFSCISYPFEIFPKPFQVLINLNPLYYIFDAIRLSWIENNFIYSISSHFFGFIILFLAAIIFPFLGILFFNKLFKKYGIVGY